MGGLPDFMRSCATALLFAAGFCLALSAPVLAGASDLNSAALRIAQAQNFEEELWDRVKDSGDPVLLETYIRTFPTGAHVPDAYEKIQQLRAQTGATREGGKSPAPDNGKSGGASSGAKAASPSPPPEETPAAASARQYRPGEGGWVGIELQPATLTGEKATAAGQKNAIRIVSVLPYGKGKEAGLKAGDFILAFEGKPVGAMSRLVESIAASKPGSTARFTLLRDLRKEEIEVRLGGRITDTIVAAEAGEASAQLSIGYAYATGSGVEKDEAEARRWYRAAAEQGNRIAQYNLGNIYREGRGVAKDQATANDWYRRSADKGYSLAQTRIGYNYVHGIGVAKNPVIGVEWYQKAAAQKEPYALNNLGMMYANGQGGLRKSRTRAIELLREAAALGNELATKNLGNMKVPVVDPAEIQAALADLGFDPGPVDGKFGPQTRRAIRAFQAQAGLPVNGKGSPELLTRLKAAKRSGLTAGAGSGANTPQPSSGSGALGDLDTLD